MDDKFMNSWFNIVKGKYRDKKNHGNLDKL